MGIPHLLLNPKTSRINIPTPVHQNAMSDQTFQLPDYFPIHRSQVAPIHSLPSESKTVSDFTRKLERELNETLTSYIDGQICKENELLIAKQEKGKSLDDAKKALLSTDKTIQTAKDLMDRICDSQNKDAKHTQAVKKTKVLIQQRLRDEVELDLNTLELYQNMNPTPKQVYELFKDQQVDAEGEEEENPRIAKKRKTFKENLFLTVNPEVPLPSEEDEDDVCISGGKIDLRCPLGKQLMEEPVRSLNCGHIFDKQNITRYMETSSRGCPECGKALQRENLKVHDATKRRLVAYKRDASLAERRSKKMDGFDGVVRL